MNSNVSFVYQTYNLAEHVPISLQGTHMEDAFFSPLPLISLLFVCFFFMVDTFNMLSLFAFLYI